MEYIVSGSGRGCHAGSLGFDLSFKPVFSAYHVTAIHAVDGRRDHGRPY